MAKKNNTRQSDLRSLFKDELIDKAENQIIEQQKIVDYEIREYPIEVLVQKYQNGLSEDTNEIFLPKYQRKFVWDEIKQSEFIESLMLGLPIPYLFTADVKEGRSEIVDGSQRIRTLVYFLNNELTLTGLKKLDALNDFKFKDLPLSRQRRFSKKTIRLIELTDKANIEVRKEIFSRINRTPAVLSDMEIRKGVYEGKFYNFIEKCAENGRFHILCPISTKREKREERGEMILRFFAYSENYQKFVHVVRDFLDEYINSKNIDGFDENLLDNDFENMLDFVEKYFPYGFKKDINNKSVPRVRFEAIAVGINLALKENPNLKNPDLTWLESDDFDEHTTSDAANNRLKLVGRIEFVRDKLLGKI
jgi:hypothetical protein